MRCRSGCGTGWTICGTFLDAAEDDRLYPLYHLAAYFGLRRGQVRVPDFRAGALWSVHQRRTGGAGE